MRSLGLLSRSAAASVALLALAGCAVQQTATSSVAAQSYKIMGHAHGGPNAIIGGLVQLWETGTTGYGQGATQLGNSTQTDANGDFRLVNATPYTCSAGKQAYLTVSGGNTIGTTANAASLLVAVIGDCSHLDNAVDDFATSLYVNEVSTVAAGFALGNFTTYSGGAGGGVNIGAPLANATVPAACTGTGANMVCAASGLQHAFANALNLVDCVGFGGRFPSGKAYTVVPTQTGNTSNAVPQALLNMMANILQSCVNSSGGTAGDGTPCGTLFANTTPPSTGFTFVPVPTNTLLAVINMAAYPTQNVANLLTLNTAFGYFKPTLTMTNDFSVAINYRVLGAAAVTVAPTALTLDIGDNVYIASDDGKAFHLTGISSAGALLFDTPSTPDLHAPFSMATDTTGNLYLANAEVSNPIVMQYDSIAGSSKYVTPLPAGYLPEHVAVDLRGTVYATLAYSGTASGTGRLATISGGVATLVNDGSAATATPLLMDGGVAGVAIDQQQQLWFANTGSTITSSILSNTGSVAAPTYHNPLQTVTHDSSHGGGVPILIDANRNGWLSSKNQIYKVQSGVATPLLSLLVQQTSGGVTTSAVSILGPAIDGAGNIYLPDSLAKTATGPATEDRIWQYNSTLGAFTYLRPCFAPLGGTSCLEPSNFGGLSIGVDTEVDSTGSLWVSSLGSGTVMQIIGSAAPAWPQKSYAHPGVMPGTIPPQAP